MGHYVYKYVYDNNIIYIGKNDTDLISRINQHRTEKNFLKYIKNSVIYYAEFDNSFLSEAFETLLITKYKPKLNSAKTNTEMSFVFDEPEWHLLDDNITKKITKKGQELLDCSVIAQQKLDTAYEKGESIIEAIKEAEEDLKRLSIYIEKDIQTISTNKKSIKMYEEIDEYQIRTQKELFLESVDSIKNIPVTLNEAIASLRLSCDHTLVYYGKRHNGFGKLQTLYRIYLENQCIVYEEISSDNKDSKGIIDTNDEKTSLFNSSSPFYQLIISQKFKEFCSSDVLYPSKDIAYQYIKDAYELEINYFSSSSKIKLFPFYSKASCDFNIGGFENNVDEILKKIFSDYNEYDKKIKNKRGNVWLKEFLKIEIDEEGDNNEH